MSVIIQCEGPGVAHLAAVDTLVFRCLLPILALSWDLPDQDISKRFPRGCLYERGECGAYPGSHKPHPTATCGESHDVIAEIEELGCHRPGEWRCRGAWCVVLINPASLVSNPCGVTASGAIVCLEHNSVKIYPSFVKHFYFIFMPFHYHDLS